MEPSTSSVSSSSASVSSATTLKPSIDRIRFQIERLAGSIYNLEQTAIENGNAIAERGEKTWFNMRDNFTKENQTIQNDIANAKFADWPVNALFAVLIAALILIFFGLLYLAAKGGEKVVQRKYKRRIPLDPTDIENI